MSMTAQQLEANLPDATQLESNEPEMESSLHYAQLALLVACYEVKTHVSLLPPPCEEFTTREPRLRATRVRPPGLT